VQKPRRSEVPSEPPPGRPALSKAEVAWLLAVSVRTVDNLLRKGLLPSVRVGRHVRIPRRSVEEYVAANARRAGGGGDVA
jgi:excisionase family DNA binding protein